jgi:iron-sulfur cluster assembly accessory protein
LDNNYGITSQELDIIITIVSKTMIELSPAAAREIERWSQSRRLGGSYLRLAVKNGGCSGLHYHLELTDIAGENDRFYQSQGINILVDPDSDRYLQILKLDYSEDLMGGGFRFTNANTQNTCGCGLSFSA